VLTDLAAALRKLAISPTSEPCALFEDANIWYAQQSDSGSIVAPSPFVIMGYRVLPSGLTFLIADPVDGAPTPVDVDDVNGLRFLALGHRCTLRGWIGTVADTLTGTLKASWADAETRTPGDPRGAWTGVLVFSFDGERQTADQLCASLQGKRPVDVNWLDYGCHLDRPIDPAGTETHASAVSADTDVGTLRVVVTGATPAWTVNLEKWDSAGMAWVVVHSVVVDLRANGVPGSLSGYGLIGALVSAATVPQPGGAWPPVAPYKTHENEFDHVEVSQFEPWVPDIAEWSRLDWQHALAAIGLTFPVSTGTQELRRAPVDLLHMPMGHAAAPAELRTSDADLGIVMRLTKDTTLWAQGRNDTPLMSIAAGTRDLAICAQDAASCGFEAPFAAVVEIKPEDMIFWITDRWILQIDNPLEGAPNAATNGMGIYYRSERTLTFDAAGYVAAVTSDIGLPVVGTTSADSGILLSYDNTARTWRVIPDAPADVFALAESVTITGGTGAGTTSGAAVFAGHLVARAYNDGVGWVDLDYDFPLATWNERAVTIAICWSGYSPGAGNTAGRPDFELRLVVDGVTRSSTVIGVDFRLEHPNPSITIGAGNGGDGFTGLFSQGALFAEVLGDLDIRAAFAEVQSDFANPDFEDPATSLRAGEAEHWLWRSLQHYNAFAEFNAYDAELEEHQGGFEDFEGGWLNDAWLADVADAVLVSAWFNVVAAHPEEVEDFEVNWSYQDLGTLAGPEWTETWIEHFVAWRGCLDPVTPVTPARALSRESFEEASATDPFYSPSGVSWTADAAQNGILRGAALSLPVHVTDARRDMWIFTKTPSTCYRLRMTVGVYATAAALAVNLNTQLAAVLTGFKFDVWTDGTSYGLTFGRDPVLTGATPTVFFGEPELDPSGSLRSTLGFTAMGPYDRHGLVRFPVSAMSPAPGVLGSLDAFNVDIWTMVSFRALLDSVLALWFTIEDDRAIAEFDTSVSEDTYLESFRMHGWYGLTAAWMAAYGPGDLTLAEFVESGTTYYLERFVTTEWPTEAFPNAH
jgi:hypothetical protein